MEPDRPMRWGVFAGCALVAAACAMPPVRVGADLGSASVSRESRRAIAEARGANAPLDILGRHLAVEEEVAGTPLSAGNRVTLLEDGQEAYPQMLAAIRGATRHVHLEMYIFEDDATGQEFAQALAERSEAGVQVRVMFDGVGSLKTAPEFFEALRAAGVDVHEFRPPSPKGLLRRGLALNSRNHRKLLVVDGRVAILGGINISDENSRSSAVSGSGGSAPGGSRANRREAREHGGEGPEDRTWRDIQMRIEGPAVADFQRHFVSGWQRETGRNLEDRSLFPDLGRTGAEVVRAIGSSPDEGTNALYVTLLSAIEHAEREIFITMAYFIPDERIIDALKAAARRGVDVRLILPGHTDSRIALAAGRSFYEELLEAGVKIFERQSRLLHAKAAVVDGVWSTVGSTNLDFRSLLHNYELNAVVLGADFAVRMRRLFERDLANSRQVTAEEWARRPLRERFLQAAARSWAYFL